jgi:acyl-coenzyme A thioesterase PaaI-like protein
VKDMHLNSMGIVHGGSIMALADTAIGFGAFLAKKVSPLITLFSSPEQNKRMLMEYAH